MHYSGYTEEQIQPVLQLMIDYLHGPVAHEAFFKKYASKKFMKGLLARTFSHLAPLTNSQPPSSCVSGSRITTKTTLFLPLRS